MQIFRVSLMLLVVLALIVGAAPAQSSAVVAVFANIWSLDTASPEIGTARIFPFAPVSPADLFAGAFPAPPPLPPTITEAAALGFPDPAFIHELDAVALANSPCVQFPPPPSNDLRIEFSIDRISVGADPVITGQTGPGGDGAAADIFQYIKNGGAPPYIGLRNNNAPPVPNSFFLTPGLGAGQSNIDAWYSQGGFQIGNTVPLPPLLPTPGIYFMSFGAGTPPPAGLAAVDPAVIYTPDGAGGMMPSAFVLAGLLAGDDIDALSVGPGVVYFSLSRTSPSVLGGFFGAADILKWTPGGGVVVWAAAVDLGLLPTDNIDALFIWDPGVTGDVDGHVSNVVGPGGSSVAQGCYFDVQADDDIVVRALDVSLASSADSTVTTELWVTNSGPAAAHVGNPNAWTRIAVDEAVVPPDGQPTRIDRLLDVALANGEVRGFFVTVAGAPVVGIESTPSGAHTLATHDGARLLGGMVSASATPGAGSTGLGAPRVTLQYDRQASGPRSEYRLSHALERSVIKPFHSVSCNFGAPDFFHDDNSYFRFYDLAAHGETRPAISIEEILFGVETAASSGAGQPITLRLHETPAGNRLTAGFSLLHQETFTIPDGGGIMRRSVPSLVFGNDPCVELVVELFTPNGVAAGNKFFLGTNDRGGTEDSRFSSPSCGFPEPTTFTSIGFPDREFLLDVIYTESTASFTYPGTRDDFDAFFAVNLAGLERVSLTGQSVTLNAGDCIEMVHVSSCGGLTGVGQYFAVGSLVADSVTVPEAGQGTSIYVDLNGGAFLFDGLTNILGNPTQLPASGSSVKFGYPGGAAAFKAVIQGFVLDGSANNSIYAATNGFTIDFGP